MTTLRFLILALSVPGLARAEERVGDAWTDARNPVRVLFNGERLDLWSLKPVVPPPVPDPAEKAWARNEVDRFILAQLEANGLKPAPEASREALVRRLYFDLTGLPPSLEAVDAFLADTGSDAVERLVDRLMETRAFAEHWARWWLDLVRYSDSNGYDWDEFRPQAWRFRDYVIRSMHAGKPLDRFVREQLAGDEMVAGAPKDAAEQDCLIATGYLRIGPWDNSSKLFNEEHKTRAAWLADLTETTAGAFLGLTMSCCRCHDHKTEPLAQVDHYRLRAFFEGVKFADDLPLDLAPEQEAITKVNAAAGETVKAQEAVIAIVLKMGREKLMGEKDDAKVRTALPQALREKLEAAEAARNAAQESRRAFTTGLCATAEKEPGVSRILAQGDPDQPREEVPPGIPVIFDPQPAVITPPAAGQGNGRRSALADWLFAPQNPLTARVIANHLWQQCFGQGIVTTAGDFGWSGARPSHPALLDWLAHRLVQDGWSMNAFVRRLYTSAAYRQAAYVSNAAQRAAGEARDAGNALLWRMNPRRLMAEQLRDAMLSAAGVLEPCDGGPPRWPVLPEEVLAANPAFYDDNAEKTKGWYTSPPEKLRVRSIYLVQKRSVRVPFMETFDLPDNFVSCTRRAVSTVAPQAATLLNNPFAVEVAKQFAARLEREPDAAKRLTLAWRLTTGRAPEAAEAAAARAAMESQSLPEFCRVLLNLNAFLYLD
jgi:hypothetical protein